jgi:PAS domain S-box-containing protein
VTASEAGGVGGPGRRPPPDVSGQLQQVVDDAVTLLGFDAAEIHLLDLNGGRTWRAGPLASGSSDGDGDRPAGGPHLGVARLRIGDDAGVLGFLSLYGRQVGRLPDRDRRLVRLLIGQATLAIENARLVEELAEQDARHRFLLDRLPDAMWAAGADRVFTYLSAGIERISGYRPDELIGRSSQIVMHESTREAWEDGYRWQIAHPDGDQTYRVNLRHKDGHPVPVELHNIGTPVDGRYGGGTGSVREISERLRLERELEEQAAELAAGRERAHLARELHDSVTQALFSMTLTAGAARRLAEQHQPGVEAKLDELGELTREALTEMRSLLFELRPGNLADAGLVAALRDHVAAVQSRAGLITRFYADPDLGRLGPAIENALYRIAQEAIHNVVKHAGAREVDVRLTRHATNVALEVRDDGVGFDAGAPTDGLGLPGMAARAERVGGSLAVDTVPGRGTVVTVVLPVSAVEDEPLTAGAGRAASASRSVSAR